MGEDSNGLIVTSSDFDVPTILDRLTDFLTDKGATIFARVDHAKGAETVEMSLPPTQVLIFGNPKVGTPLMMSNPAIALDLPLKACAWGEENGPVKLA